MVRRLLQVAGTLCKCQLPSPGCLAALQFPLFKRLMWYAAESALFRQAELRKAFRLGGSCRGGGDVAFERGWCKERNQVYGQPQRSATWPSELIHPLWFLPPAVPWCPLCRLRQCVRQAAPPQAAGIAPWEHQGLPALAGLLREWLEQQQGGGSGARRTAGEHVAGRRGHAFC